MSSPCARVTSVELYCALRSLRRPNSRRACEPWRGILERAAPRNASLFTAARRLYSLDAATGHPVRTFGDSGCIDLSVGLGRKIGDEWILATSPGVIYQDLLIQGTRVGEGDGSAPGHIRAYDVRTGKIRWTFRTIPRAGRIRIRHARPRDAWKSAGGANSWAGMALDVKRGIVYVPTGSSTPDFYGGARVGQNLFANTLLALDARTGKRRWHFQTVHHDVLDRDLPAAPNLVTVKSMRDALTSTLISAESPSQGSCSCSIAKPESHSFPSRSAKRLRPT